MEDDSSRVYYGPSAIFDYKRSALFAKEKTARVEGAIL